MWQKSNSHELNVWQSLRTRKLAPLLPRWLDSRKIEVKKACQTLRNCFLIKEPKRLTRVYYAHVRAMFPTTGNAQFFHTSPCRQSHSINWDAAASQTKPRLPIWPLCVVHVHGSASTLCLRGPVHLSEVSIGSSTSVQMNINGTACWDVRTREQTRHSHGCTL